MMRFWMRVTMVATLFLSVLRIAAAQDASTTRAVAGAWKETDLESPGSPGCSVIGVGPPDGASVMMGVGRAHAKPMALVFDKPSWAIPEHLRMLVRVTFPKGGNYEFTGIGKGRLIDVELTDPQVKQWTHDLTAGTTMVVNYGGNEPAWTLDLSGTSKVISAFAACITEHAIVGVAAPFDVAPAPDVQGTAPPTQPFSAPAATATQPFSPLTPSAESVTHGPAVVTSGARYGTQDIAMLRTRMDADGDAFMRDFAGQSFSATGTFEAFEVNPVGVGVYIASVMTRGGQVSCFFPPETGVTSMPYLRGQPVTISGTVGMAVQSALVLGKGCLIRPLS